MAPCISLFSIHRSIVETFWLQLYWLTTFKSYKNSLQKGQQFISDSCNLADVYR